VTNVAAEALVGDAAAAASPTGRRAPKPPLPTWRKRERRIGLFAVLPAVLVVAAVMLYPIGFALWLSLNKTNGIKYEFRGLRNYTDLLTDPLLWQVVSNNIKFLISVPLVITAALCTSVLLFEKIRGWRYFRVIFFLPSVLSTAVVGLLFRSLFGYNGVVNSAVVAAGGQPIEFFTEANLAISVIVIALVWSGFGYQSLLLLSGLTAIDPAVFEAAMLDGAGWWKRIWYITLPQIRRTIGFVFIINVLYTFTSLFGFVFVMTAGGPGYDTTTVDYLIYLKAFGGASIGSGAALAVMLFILVGALTFAQNKVFRIGDDD